MSTNKRYYWLKLDENFFEDDTIAWLEEQENGKDYVIFYLKLALRSLKDDGKLIRYVGERLIPYDVKALAKLTDTPVDTVAIAMKTFLEIGLVEQLDSGEIFLSQIDEMVGSETEVAKRVRKHRAKKALGIGEEPELLQSNVHETKSNTELEIEIDKELEEVRSPAKAEPDIPFKEIIEYLNKKADRNFKYTTNKTKRLIRARYNEGFKQEDFEKVIDVKVNQWKGKADMEKYLRPETLFGTKFEGYLNEQNTTDERNWDEWDFLK